MPLLVVERRIRHRTVRKARHLDGLRVAGVVDGHADEPDGTGRASRTAHRRGVLVGAVVQEPHMTARDDGVPAIGMGGAAVVAVVPPLVERQCSAIPVGAPDRLRPDGVHRVPVGRQSGDGRLGQDERWTARLERCGVEQGEFGAHAEAEVEILDRQ